MFRSTLFVQSLSLISFSPLILACGTANHDKGQNPDSGQSDATVLGSNLPENVGRTFEKGSDPGQSASTPSLDLAGWGLVSSDWCQAPAFHPTAYQTLDLPLFSQLVAEYALGWSNPGYETLLGLDEQALYDSFFELILATFRRECRHPQDWQEFPSTDMLDAGYQQEGKDAIVEFLSQAQVLESGELLRLSLKECHECGETLGSSPNYVNAQLTDDGVLAISLETDGSGSSEHTIYLSQDAVIFEGSLGDASAWFKDLTTDTRSGEVILPRAEGVATWVLIKDNQGGVTSTLGIDNLSFEALPGDDDNFFASASDCIGMHFALKASEQVAALGVAANDFKLDLPGQVQCGAADCGERELNGTFSYQLGGVTAVAEQPDGSSDHELRLHVASERATTAQVAGTVFAEGGPGKDGRGGALSLEVDAQPDGYLVTFASPLTMGAAMKLTDFSQKTRLTFPTWLQDEIFDVTFGGDPVASVFVPRRSDCPVDEDGLVEWVSDTYKDGQGFYERKHLPYDVERRELRIESGTLTAETGGGTKVAAAGQCLAQTQLNEEQISRTSDWVELGIACSNQ